MKTLIKRIEEGKFAFEKYLGGKTYFGKYLLVCPMFCSYGQIGYKVNVFENGKHVATITHDWEMDKTKCEYV